MAETYKTWHIYVTASIWLDKTQLGEAVSRPVREIATPRRALGFAMT